MRAILYPSEISGRVAAPPSKSMAHRALICAALANPEVRKKLQDLHIAARSGSPEQTRQLLESEIKRWGEVITRANIPRQ